MTLPEAISLIEKGYTVYGGDIQVEANLYLNDIGGHALVMDVPAQPVLVYFAFFRGLEILLIKAQRTHRRSDEPRP